mgnify:CR=1 FL=1
MNDNKTKTGSKKEFDENWKTRKETSYGHWTRGMPKNQVQLAFRSHWEVFNELIGKAAHKKGKALEVGCGRGSLSSYFVDNGWDVTLLDYSDSVLEAAKSIFKQNGHKAEFVQGDANSLQFENDSFDITYSIGLLEHFEDVKTPISEQLRILKPGGWFLGYIVPERPDNLQKYFNWVNKSLKFCASIFSKKDEDKQEKEEIFRSDNYSQHYLSAMEGLEYEELHVFGMYSMPMVSHSPEFPFSLLPKPLEWVLARIFQGVMFVRKLITGKHGWICSEQMGQAFLIAFRKPS